MKAAEYFRFLVESPVANIAKYYIDVYLKSSETKPLSDFVDEIKTGKTPSKNNSRYYESEDFDWFKPNEIGLGIYLKNAQDKVSNYAVKENQVTIFQPETLLINCIGDIGRVGILKKAASSNQQITGVRFNKSVLPEYAFFYFVSHRNLLVDDASSTTLPIINQKKLLLLPFKVPDIKEQKKILLYLNDCLNCLEKDKTPDFSRYDFDDSLISISKKIYSLYYFQKNLFTELTTQQTLITQLRQSILQEAVQGKLVKQNKNDEPASELLKKIKAEKEKLIKQGKLKKEKPLPPIAENEIRYPLPEGWMWCRMGDVLKLINGRAYKQHELLTKGTPVLRIQNLNGGVRWYYSDIELPEDKYCEQGDLLFAWFGTFGPYIWEGEKSIFHYHIWKIKLSPAIDKMYLFYMLKFLMIEIKAQSHGLMLPHMTKEGMESWLISLPPLPEQKRIVEKVNQLMQHCHELEQQVQQSISHAQQLMQAVLREVFEKKKSEPLIAADIND